MHQIVVVGGGAGGLELVTRLARRWGAKQRTPRASITLVDINPTHLWKPLLHKVAAGSLNTNMHQLEYAAQAKWCGFTFQQGALKHIEHGKQYISLAPVLEEETKIEIFPERTIPYDTLVISIGSVTDFFGVPGAKEHSFSLDTTYEAERFRRQLIKACLHTQYGGPKPLYISIVGAGSTGVELAAELRHTMHALGAYGIHHLDPQRDIQVTLIEAAPRILPALPEQATNATLALLKQHNIEIKVNALVEKVNKESLFLKGDEMIPSHLTIWAAGIKAPPILNTLESLSLNRQGQIIVHPTLQSISDANIFSFGDCASCPWIGKPEGTQVPPRAQAAHQQVIFLTKQLKDRLNGKIVKESFRYRDFGVLISLGETSAVGNLQDGITKQGFVIRGWVARWMYSALYRLRLAALHGWIPMILHTVGEWLSGSSHPRVKLH